MYDDNLFYRLRVLEVKYPVLILLILSLCTTVLCTDSPTRQEIMRPGSNYYWGQYTAAERDVARDRALAELSSNIAVTVRSDFEHRWQETDTDYEDFMESVVTTYTSTSFTNLQPLLQRDEHGNFDYLFFISRDDLQREFDERRERILAMYDTAKQAEASANISRALQFYYYSIILMNSVPDRNIVYNDVNLTIDIPNRIRNIIRDVEFFYEKDIRPTESLRRVILRVEYHGKPVQELDFVYLERGSEYTARARDGRAICELTGASITYNDLEVEIEYRYAAAKDCDPLVAQLWEGVNRPSFDSRRNISFEEPPVTAQAAEQELQPLGESERFRILLTNSVDTPIKPQIKQETISFLDALSANDPAKIKDQYSSDPFLHKKLSDLSKYNNPQLIDDTLEVEMNKTWLGWELRSIPVFCSYPSIRTQSIEYLVLDFDEKGNLVDFSMNVFEELYNTYVKDVESSEEERLQRQTIIKFLERYRTAFMNRDIETLEKIFADEAVIIVGRVLEPGTTDRQYNIEKEFQQIEYLRLTKDNYLRRQKAIFDRQRDIHLGFNTFRVLKKDQDTAVYGISMRQQYASSGYADEGYLFLLIDFMEDDPLIYVRSWQPGEWSEKDMINMYDFRVLE